MTIIDRYILFHFFRNFLLWLFCLAGVVVLLDVFTKIDSLIEAGREAGSVWQTFVGYGFFRMLPMTLSMSALIALASAMMTIASMMRANELVPIQAAGISDLRIIAPFIGAVIFIAAGGVILREVVLPRYMDRLTDQPATYVNARGMPMMSKVDNETGITLQGDRIFTRTREIAAPTFTLRVPLVKRVTVLKAARGIYCEANQQHPAGFLLKEVADLGELQNHHAEFNGRVIVFSPTAASWLAKNECFVATRIPFMCLAISDSWRIYASTWDMMAAVRNPSVEIGTSQYSIIHGRIAQPFLDLALVFLGLPLLFTRVDRNIFKTLGVSALLVFSVLIVREAALFLGSSSGAPVLGAWIPLMIFVPLSARSFYGLIE